MTSNRQWAKGTEMSSVPERDKAKGDDDQQNGLFVNVPPKEKRCIPAKSDSTDKCLP